MFTGIWHGASWNFVFWGLYFGILLCVEKIYLLKKLEKLPSVISRCYTLFVVMISFVIFSSDSLETAMYQIKCILGMENIMLWDSSSLYYLRSYIVVIVVSIIASTPILKLNRVKKVLTKVNCIEPIIIIGLLLISTAYLVDSSFNPFLYFRF